MDNRFKQYLEHSNTITTETRNGNYGKPSVTHLKGNPVTLRGTRWCSELRHFAKSRKVAGSIPDDVTGIFH